jgi:hypothetical protein
MTEPTEGEIYFEFVANGAFVRVTAIEAASGCEASIIGPRDAPQNELERLALAMLEFVRQKGDKIPRPPSKGVLA